MSRLPATAVLRLACWCLCLLFVAWAGNVTPGAAEPRAAASSVFARPVALPQHPPPPPPQAPVTQPASEPAPAPTPTPPPPRPPPPQPRMDATAAAIVTLTNQLRAQHGLPLLAVSYALATAAQAYAETMAANDWFAHEGPDG